MNSTKKIFLLFFGIAFNLFAQNTFEFLRLNSSPRAAALADAYVADNKDPNVVFYNPAGITDIENTLISFSYLKHLADINVVGLSSSFKIKGVGKFASAIKYINYGTIEKRDINANKLGVFTPSDLALIIAYGNKYTNNIKVGASVKLIYSNIATYSSFGVAGDIGLQYNLEDKGWNIGLSLLNIGSQITYYNEKNELLPFSVQLGATKKLERMPLQIFFAFTRLNDEKRFKYFNIGGEFTFSKVIQLRIGYENIKRDNFKIAETSSLGGFSFGMGINISNYNFDYAFSSIGAIGAIHRIGITTAIK